MTADPDTTRIVRSWLRADEHESGDRVLHAVLARLDATPQRRSWWPAWRDFRMHKITLAAATAVTVLVTGVVGYGLLGGFRIPGPGATSVPSTTILARGSFVLADGGYTVALEAFERAADVTGRMTVSEGSSGPAFTVDLQCARTTEDGSVSIGGVTTNTTTGVAPRGAYAGIVLKGGSPAQAAVWSQRGGSASEASTCQGYLDEQLERRPPQVAMAAIVGTLELASSDASSNLLASGTFVIRDWNNVQFEAIRSGSGVTGTLTARRNNAASAYLQVGFQCVAATEDGLIVIGGSRAPIAESTDGTFGAIALKRGTPIRAQIWAYGPSFPGMQGGDCMANAAEWARQLGHADYSELRDDINGTFEFGP